MYGKFFASAFTGSMMASGCEVFAVWAYVIANTVQSHVELNPKLLAAVIGSTPDRMQKAIETLCDLDPNSRSKDREGRRLVRDGEYQYFVVNHEQYRGVRDEEGRREYNRIKQQEARARKASKGVKQSVNDSQQRVPPSAEAEAEAEAEVKKVKVKSIAPQATPHALLKDVNPKIVQDWLAVRKAKKAAVTETAINGIRREAEKAGLSMEAVLTLCCERGWSGFKASWDLTDKSAAPDYSRLHEQIKD